MISRVVWIVQVGCAAWIGLTVTWEAARGTDADKAPGPPLKPKPYQVGIAPSHIAKPTAPLFGDRVDDWDEVRNNIDFYKVYSLQAVPPRWASPLPVDSFADFVREHKIAVDAEFGDFRPGGGVGEGMAAARRAQAMHAWLGHKFKALQRSCEERDIDFWLVVNFDTNPQSVAGKTELGNRLFHDETVAFIRRLRKDGIFPDCFTIQSWYKLPEEHLPEDGGHSFMHTARDSIRLIRQLFPQADPMR